MPNERNVGFYVGTMAREIRAMFLRSCDLIPPNRDLVGIERRDLERLSKLAEVYLDNGNIELWITGFEKREDFIRTIKAVRQLLSLGLKESKEMVDQGCPFKLRSYTSLVDVERDEKVLCAVPTLTFERRSVV